MPESLELALATAMAKSATSRYSSAHAFALALQRIQAELNLSVTPFEVLEERHQEDDHADDGVEETRVRNVASIDPERTGSAPTFPARTWPLIGGQQGPSPAAQPAAPPSAVPWTSPSKPSAAPGTLPAAFPAPAADDGGDWAQATVLRSSRPEPAPGPENPEPARDHGKRNLWLAIAGGTLLVLAIAVGIIVASTAPQPQALPSEQPSKPPADALDDGSVPDVAKLAGSVGAGGKVRFTWTNPQPKQGDTYKWRIKTVKGGGNYLSTTAPRVDVSANPTEPTCVQVIIVRNDGSASPAGEDSIACVWPGGPGRRSPCGARQPEQLTRRHGKMGDLAVDFCGEWYEPSDDDVFSIGREGDLEVDDNPYLHRRFLQIARYDGIWWLSNVGSMLSATVADASGGMQAWLSPGARLPLVFSHTNIIFTAGPTTYEFSVHVKTPAFRQETRGDDTAGDTTIGPVVFTDSQKALIVALAEPMLRRDGTGFSAIPSSAAAAKTLGWALTRFNRKLDNVCDKLDRVGVAGLRGGGGKAGHQPACPAGGACRDLAPGDPR